MKKTLIASLVLIVTMLATSAHASFIKPTYCKIAINGKEPIILKLDQYPAQLALFQVKEYNFKNLIISEIVFKKSPAVQTIN